MNGRISCLCAPRWHKTISELAAVTEAIEQHFQNSEVLKHAGNPALCEELDLQEIQYRFRCEYSNSMDWMTEGLGSFPLDDFLNLVSRFLCHSDCASRLLFRCTLKPGIASKKGRWKVRVFHGLLVTSGGSFAEKYQIAQCLLRSTGLYSTVWPWG